MPPIASVLAAVASVALVLPAAAAAQAGTHVSPSTSFASTRCKARKSGIGCNNNRAATVMRFKEGQRITLNVTNSFLKDTSIY